ncbi:hypothetical protein GUITHDRAFT_112043 [Guillardia theta CCMP2712]|uniref:Uncharacterized protein n=1 Tax=Guillardia theta (strain CCMP2712) TaxID=905079 RepID=L1J0T0_GUITC|nr:hypothetical protein GUITHDRAFT_112043 [Guillardia theta CCMP2712]EKX41907.1 hypothetical protein GUITHDRAFT_112043 [Guillardia theta CCMP2712]|eukprot:XP_005828887.1 hypothetical protein GUITHDRAFT_112043 [Guillardia theta CCMP2712]
MRVLELENESHLRDEIISLLHADHSTTKAVYSAKIQEFNEFMESAKHKIDSVERVKTDLLSEFRSLSPKLSSRLEEVSTRMKQQLLLEKTLRIRKEEEVTRLSLIQKESDTARAKLQSDIAQCKRECSKNEERVKELQQELFNQKLEAAKFTRVKEDFDSSQHATTALKSEIESLRSNLRTLELDLYEAKRESRAAAQARDEAMEKVSSLSRSLEHSEKMLSHLGSDRVPGSLEREHTKETQKLKRLLEDSQRKCSLQEEEMRQLTAELSSLKRSSTPVCTNCEKLRFGTAKEPSQEVSQLIQTLKEQLHQELYTRGEMEASLRSLHDANSSMLSLVSKAYQCWQRKEMDKLALVLQSILENGKPR